MDEENDIEIFFEKFSNTEIGAKTRRKEDIFPVTLANRKEGFNPGPKLEYIKKRNGPYFNTGTSTSNELKKAGKLSDKTLKRKSLVANKVKEVNVKKNSIKVQSNLKMKGTVVKKKVTNRNTNGLTSSSSLMNNPVIIFDEEQTSKPRMYTKKICTEPLPASVEPRSTRSVSRANKTKVKKSPSAIMTVCRDNEGAVREYYANLRTSNRDRNLLNRNDLEKSKEKLMRENCARNVTSTVTSGALQTWDEPLRLQNNVYFPSSEWNSNASPLSDWNSDSDTTVVHLTEENKPILPSNSHTSLETTMQKKLYLGSCPICFEELLETQIGATICGHVFCMSCLTQTVENLKYCPNCRKRLEPSDIISLYF